MQIAVIGASGHLGNNLVRTLLQKNFSVRAIALDADNAPSLANLSVERCVVDIRNKQAVEKAIIDCDVVYHCAAKISIHQDKDGSLFDINVNGTRHIAAACLRQGSRLIHISSIHAFRLPKRQQTVNELSSRQLRNHRFDYDQSKAQADQVITDFIKQGLDACILYPTALLGPMDFEPSLSGNAMLSYAKGEIPMTVRGGFNYVDVRDMVQTMINAIELGKSGEDYLIAGDWYAVGKLSKVIEEISNVRAPNLHLPIWLARISARCHMLKSRLLKQKPLYTNQSIASLHAFETISDAKARRELGHRTRPIEQTLYDLLSWYQDRGMLSKQIQLKPCPPITELETTKMVSSIEETVLGI